MDLFTLLTDLSHFKLHIHVVCIAVDYNKFDHM